MNFKALFFVAALFVLLFALIKYMGWHMTEVIFILVLGVIFIGGGIWLYKRMYSDDGDF